MEVVEGTGDLYPCTPRGILRLLDYYGIDIVEQVSAIRSVPGGIGFMNVFNIK